METENKVPVCRALLEEGKRCLAEAGLEEAGTDARLLFLFVFRVPMDQLLLHYEETPERLPGIGGAAEAARRSAAFREAVRKRAAHMPLQYITGEQNFCGIDLFVDERVLIPRQDTEILVETVLRNEAGGALLDLCTGSGCIPAALKTLGRFDTLTAADLSADALAVAAENVRRAGGGIRLVQSDLFSAFAGERFDVITANPPYIPTSVVETLSPEVRDHEPRMALDGTADGLQFYRRLAEECPEHLTPGGRVYFEIGFDQREAVTELLTQAGFEEVRCVKDYAGLDRVMTGRIGNHV